MRGDTQLAHILDHAGSAAAKAEVFQLTGGFFDREYFGLNRAQNLVPLSFQLHWWMDKIHLCTFVPDGPTLSAMKTHLQALDQLRLKQHAAGARPSRRSFDHLEPYLLDAEQKYRPVHYLLPFLRQPLLRTSRSYYDEETDVTSLPMRLNGKFQEVEVLPDGRLALDSEILPAFLIQHNRDPYYDISLAAMILLFAQKIWALDTFGGGRKHLHADICEVVEQAIELAARILHLHCIFS
ncbi:hypothetical protein Rhopal_006117-T1 [Rhodotorula paludigena]|uniref:HNH nuclease domain-containing protein n=1 Tax=Rhodotorula paludigena TaxID=86838 RepID=A0AAV5GUP2_9BASI|nr:hypothetical protein Rhopal_006117-T1 [Rhodotorula paludigena]